MNFESKVLYIPVAKKRWKELGSALVARPAEGWEPSMAVPLISLTANISGISESRTTAIIHYFRRSTSSWARAGDIDARVGLSAGHSHLPLPSSSIDTALLPGANTPND